MKGATPEVSPDLLMQLAMGGVVAQALAQVARYGIADLLAEGPRSAEELAAQAKVNADALRRVLSCLEAYGIFAQPQPGVFALLPLGKWLRSDRPDTLAPFVRMMTDDWQWRSFSRLDYSVGSGESSFERMFGIPWFDYLSLHPVESEIFDRAMTVSALHHHRGALAATDLSGVRSIVDVAGGKGARLAAILQDHPGMKGVLFDQPRVVEGAPKLFEDAGLAGRWSVVGGDLLSELPAGYDAYLLARVLHVWSEERALRLLANVRRALPENGRLLLLETIVPEGASPHSSRLLDLVMLTVCGSRERTEREYVALLARAGLEVTRVIPTQTMVSVIEAVRANTV